jgi:uncharacterized membrane protein YgcG
MFRLLLACSTALGASALVTDYPRVGQLINGTVYDDFVGQTVATNDDGSILAIGATGAVRMWKFETTSTSWTKTGDLTLPYPGTTDFGYCVDLSGEGTRMIAGGPSAQGDKGVVRVYEYDGAQWNQMGPDFVGGRNDRFGFACSISKDGQTIALGVPYHDPGEVRAYKWSAADTAWAQVGETIASSSAFFGSAVSLSQDGTRLAVGARLSQEKGAAMMYDLSTGEWKRFLTHVGHELDDRLGWSLDISDDGTRFIVGAPTSEPDEDGHNNGSVQVWASIAGSWDQVGVTIHGEQQSIKLGETVAISGDGKTVVVGAPEAEAPGQNTVQNSGQADVYSLVESTDVDSPYPKLVHAGRLTFGQHLATFGKSVALSGDGKILVVGAPSAGTKPGGGTNYQGMVTVYNLATGAADGSGGGNNGSGGGNNGSGGGDGSSGGGDGSSGGGDAGRRDGDAGRRDDGLSELSLGVTRSPAAWGVLFAFLFSVFAS